MGEREPSPHDPIARWKWVQTWSPHVTGAAFVVLSDLALRCGRTGKCWPSYKTIGDANGLSVSGVRKAVAQLEKVGAVTVEGSGGRRANGGGLSCTYTLNVSRAGQVSTPSTCPAGDVNVSRQCAQRVPPVASTCPGRDYKGGIEGGIEGGLQHREPCGESHPQAGKATKASPEIIAAIARSAAKFHLGLRYVPRDFIAKTVEQYPMAMLRDAWKDCDRFPPEGQESAAQYLMRLKGRPNGSGGWDTYTPKAKRTEPLTQDEAVQLAKQLNDTWMARALA